MSDESPRPAANCHYCGKRFPPTKANKQRSYCDDSCKQAAYRARMRSRSDVALLDPMIIKAHEAWHRQGYPDTLIEALMAHLYTYGGTALESMLRILKIHEGVVVKSYIERYMQLSDESKARVQALEDRIKTAERNAT